MFGMKRPRRRAERIWIVFSDEREILGVYATEDEAAQCAERLVAAAGHDGRPLFDNAVNYARYTVPYSAFE